MQVQQIFLHKNRGFFVVFEVLTKVYALDNAYSTGILSNHFVSLAKHIVDKNIDSDIENGRLEVVEHIRNALGINNYYSFATKYCSFHNPDTFPIYDSRVVFMLRYFRRKSNFTKFTGNDLKDYQKFYNIISKFREYYRLDFFSLREIDKYLWLTGKECSRVNS